MLEYKIKKIQPSHTCLGAQAGTIIDTITLFIWVFVYLGL